ncbi:hypothetical protein ACWGLE_14845 [Streptomyces sp. NPDC055897]
MSAGVRAVAVCVDYDRAPEARIPVALRDTGSCPSDSGPSLRSRIRPRRPSSGRAPNA